ncbi:glycosyl hydrolase family 28-related protein [Asaia sp. VD9]|uniref:glycosyl hydrolase family 28-related protein n=1 Tax=Asaia sp. VD9 TaxID=3081235 RepID=UPI00301B4B91
MTGNYTVCVKDFGAKGDGTSDDSAAFNEAIAALSTSGGMIYVPTGIYIVENIVLNVDTLSTLGHRIGFYGDGSANSVLSSSEATNSSFIVKVESHPSEAANSVISGVSFRDMQFAILNGLGTPFILKNTAYASFYSCIFRGGSNTFHSDGSLSSSFINCQFTDAHDHGLFADPGSFAYPNQLSFFQCVFGANGITGLYAINPGGIRVFGGSIEGNGIRNGDNSWGGGVVIDSTGGAGNNNCLSLYGVYFESNRGMADIMIVHADSAQNINFNVSDCSFGRGNTIDAVNNIYVNNVTSTTVTGLVTSCNFHEISNYSPSSQYRYIAKAGLGITNIIDTANTFGSILANPAPGDLLYSSYVTEQRIASDIHTGPTSQDGSIQIQFRRPYVTPPKIFAQIIDGGPHLFFHKVTALSSTCCTVQVFYTETTSFSPVPASNVTVDVQISGTVAG